MTEGKPKTAIVVGAGVGGVALAARLASAGVQVTLLEKNDFVGGRCSSLRRPNGYRFDQGPSLLLLPELFKETFADLGTSLEGEGIELRRCSPNYKISFGDGEVFVMDSDLAKMKSEIERYEGEEGYKGYLDFLSEAHTHYHLSIKHVLNRNFTSLLSMLRPSFLSHLLVLHPFESIYSRASRYFKTDRLRRVFTFASMYMGMSPFDALATYSLLQYTELAEGIWYPVGGFDRIPNALHAIGARNGVTTRTSTGVSKVLLSSDGERATGVKLESGEDLLADVVIVNADLVWAMNNLFEGTAKSKRLAEKPVSCSSISFYWSMDRVVPELGSHTIFLADQYQESFDSIFKGHTIPDEPSFYVNVPSRVDASASPPNKDSIVVLVPTGHLSSALPTSSDWDRIVNSTREHILTELGKRLGLTSFRSWIVDEEINTPISWRDKFNLHRGSILGLSHSFFNVLSFRPPTRHPSIDGAYFVGASTHPGTGVPIVIAGARITAEQVLADLKITPPWLKIREEAAFKKAQGMKALDRRQVRAGGTEAVLWILAGMVALLAVLLLRQSGV